MGFRETMNRNPAITTGVTIGLIVIAIVLIVWQLLPSGGSVPSAEGRKAYYSDDDGKTWFEDDLLKVTPYTGPNGKEAVRAHVFKIGDGEPFVQYLEKFKPDVKDKVEKAMADPANKGMIPPEFRDDAMKLFKKPGAANKWVPGTFELMTRLRQVEKDGAFGIEIWPPTKN